MIVSGRTVTLMTDLLSASGMMAAQPVTRDFSRPRKRLTFTVDGEVFEAAPALPGLVYAQFVMLAGGGGEPRTFMQTHEMLRQAVELVLLPDSFERFANRLKDKTNPIEHDQMDDIIMWLMEVYGMRPTRPSQLSSDGPSSPESGTSSTDEQPEQASIPATFQPTGS